jgi:hypothetical protein
LPLAILAFLGPNPETGIIISYTWVYLWIYPLGILWRRLFLVGPNLFFNVTAGRLFQIWLRLIAFYVKLSWLMLFILVVPIITIFGLISFWCNNFGTGDVRIGTLTGLIMISTAVFLFFVMPLRFMPSCIGLCVEKNIPLRKSWPMMKGHAAHLFLTMVPLVIFSILLSIIILILLSLIIRLITDANMDPHTSPLIGDILLLLLSPFVMAIWIFPMAAMAIVYRELVPQPEHIVDVRV